MKITDEDILIISTDEDVFGIISTDEDPSLQIESSAIINLRGVSTKLNKYIVFTMQTYKKLISIAFAMQMYKENEDVFTMSQQL